MRHLAAIALVVVIGCQSNDDATPNQTQQNTNTNTTATNQGSNNASNNATTSTQNNSVPADCGSAAEVSFETSDGVTLAADFHPAPEAGRGAVVLLHMIPPGNDRTTYPLRVRQALADLGLNVLNVDRRGAGDSGGVARDAYTGETASLDVEAAVAYLLADDRACAVDGSKLMLVGASNGTTSVLDYTVSRQEDSLPDPTAMAWLSPGTYTESQNTLAENPLTELPLLIVHPDSEPWATELTAPSAWKVVEIPNGGHGTQNFDDGEREVIQLAELVAWAQAHVAP